MSEARCMWMRSGTSKGAYFLAEDLPENTVDRDAFLLRIMGSPDIRQIDGMGGANPLTSKVAVVQKSRNGADVDYLFLQVSVDVAQVSSAQNCGNILAGVGAFSIERGLVNATDKSTEVSVFMENTRKFAALSVPTLNGEATYQGSAKIDGVPGSAAPVAIVFKDIAGSSCGALLPTHNVVDVIDGISVTLIDNGMPCVVILAADMGISGRETIEQLEGNSDLRNRLEKIRLQAGKLMNLGDVQNKTVPKMTMVSAPQKAATICTRTFIPHRCHASIGVLGAVSIATACTMVGSIAHGVAALPKEEMPEIRIEHPSGMTPIKITQNGAAVLRTARKLFDGIVYG